MSAASTLPGTETINPGWGLSGVIPANTTGWWGCRAIDARGKLDILPDRVSSGGPVAAELVRLLNGGGLTLLQRETVKMERDSTKAISLDYGRVRAEVRRAAGYFYISAWFNAEKSVNPAEVGWIPHASVEGTPAAKDQTVIKWSGKAGALPPSVGTEIEISMNGIGRATVVGHFIEYGYLGVWAVAHKAPDWMQKQKGGLKCPVVGVFGAELLGV